MLENGFGFFELTEKATESIMDFDGDQIRCFKNFQTDEEKQKIPPDVGMEKITQLLLWAKISLLLCCICLCVEKLLSLNSCFKTFAEQNQLKAYKSSAGTPGRLNNGNGCVVDDVLTDEVKGAAHAVVNGEVILEARDALNDDMKDVAYDTSDDIIKDEVIVLESAATGNVDHTSGQSVQPVKPYILQCKNRETISHDLPGSVFN